MSSSAPEEAATLDGIVGAARPLAFRHPVPTRILAKLVKYAEKDGR